MNYYFSFVGERLRWRVKENDEIPHLPHPNFMIRIGLCDDHAIVRTGLKQFFSTHVDLRVVGEVANGREAIDLVRTADMDVLVMDLSMPGQSGIDVLPMIKLKAPDLGVLILSGYPEEQYALSLLKNGASGYLTKDCNPQEVIDAVRTIALGKRYITSGVASLLAAQLVRKTGALPHELLSNREFQVFRKLAEGQTPGLIGQNLSLNIKTISTYRTRVLDKLNLKTNSDLTYYALKNKLIE